MNVRQAMLGTLLVLWTASIVACLGDKGEEGEEKQEGREAIPAEVQPAQELDPRHLQRINAQKEPDPEPAAENGEEGPNSDRQSLDFGKRRGPETGAMLAAEFFVERFVKVKYQVTGRFRNPQMKYFDETKEWEAFGVLKSTNPNEADRYAATCQVYFNDQNEWECRLLTIDNRREYVANATRNTVELPNLITDADGLPLKNQNEAGNRPPGEAVSDSEKKVDKSAEEEADGKLRLAKGLLNQAPEKAKRRLQEIIDKYPDTPAAEEAADLIKSTEE